MITRTETVRRYDNSGNITYEQQRVVDITAETVADQLHAKVRQALEANNTFLKLASPANADVLAQVRRLTRECSALIRLLGGPDLLVEHEDL